MMDGQAIGTLAIADVLPRALPSEAIGPRAAGTRAAESRAAKAEERIGKSDDGQRVADATRP